MRFRPRYSLLTLLLFTALVAGGVKLWRGPHRVRIGEMPTTFEQGVLASGQAMAFTTDEWQYEYDFVRNWSDRRVTSVTGFPITSYFLVTVGMPVYHPGRKCLFSAANYHKYLSDSSLVTSAKDQVHCWVQSGRKPTERNILAVEELLNSYIVTEKGNIYEMLDSGRGIQYSSISIDKIVDPNVRTRIEEEFQKLSIQP